MVTVYRKGVLRLLLFLSATVSVFTYCSKEKPITNLEPNLISRTKEVWSNIDYNKELLQNLDDSLYLQWNPQWESVSEKEQDGILYTYVPLTYQLKRKDDGNPSTTIEDNKRMFLLIKDDGNEKKYFLESIFPDKENGIEGALEKQLSASKLSGSLTLKEINTSNVFSYTYLNGVGTASAGCTYQTECHWASNAACNGSMVLSLSRSPVSDVPYRYPCPNPPELATCPGVGFRVTRSYTITNCTTGSTPPPAPPTPPPGSPSGPPIGVGWQGEDIQSAIPVDSNIRKVVSWCSNLPLDMRRSFVDGFYGMLNDQPGSCAYSYLYKQLINPQKKIMFQVCLQSGGNGAKYQPSIKVMYFGASVYASYPNLVRHEFFHVYQDNYYQDGIEQYGNRGIPNIEFEYALFSDIINKEFFAFQNNVTPEDRAAYEAWLREITANFTKVPKSFDELGGRYYEFMDKWKKKYSEYDKETIYDLRPAAMLNIFVNSGCY